MIKRKKVFVIGIVTCCILFFVIGHYFQKTSASPNPLDKKLGALTDSPLPVENRLSVQATGELSQQKDPFKAFLENKANSNQLAPSQDKTIVPGTDPFKAKLEEQNNKPHSAVSPFKD
jgi:hypothetical protein